MKKVSRNMKSMLTQLHIKSMMLKARCADVLTNEKGESHLIAVLGMVLLVLVVIGTIAMPALKEMFTGSFDNASSMMDDISNYKG